MASGTSYNGWPGNSDPDAIGVTDFGDRHGFPFPGGVKAGDVATVLGYVCTQLHTRVEPCVSGWTWGYSWKQNVNNPSQLSCHASGTAIDWNAPDHPNGSSGTFSAAQVDTIYQILDEVQGSVDWLQGYDEMHFEIACDATTLARVAASLPGGSVPPEQDWFAMASEDDLRRIVGEEIDRRLGDIGVAVWSTNINERGAANGMLNSADLNAQWANEGVKDLPTNVWLKTITDETANVLLARAANG